MIGLSGLFLLAVLSLFVIQFLKLLWARTHFPPGPTPLPVIGNLWLLDFSLKKEILAKLANIYGDIYTIWAGTMPFVVLNGYKAVKECLVTHSEETAGRALSPFYKDLMGEKGIYPTNNHNWKQQKYFAMMALRSLGVGKKHLEHRIHNEAHQLLMAVTSKEGLAFDPRTPINHAVANVICSLLFGHRFASEDDSFNRLIKATYLIVFIPASFRGGVYNVFPWIMRRLQGSHQQAFEYNNFLHALVKDEVQSHQERWKEGQEPEDLIDLYLDQMAKSKDEPTSTFNEDNLVQTVVDLLIGGTVSTTTILYWGLLYLLKYPDVQEKIHEEIDAVLRPSHVITYEDRIKVPYTNAVLHEVMRHCNVSITGPFRKCLEDFTLLGFPLKKGTLVLPNLHSALYDPEYWETPWTFNPGHFLDSFGRFASNKAFLPFSTGRRSCVGEPLARIELFIFFANLLRAFKFHLPDAEKEVNMEAINVGTCQPHPYRILAIPR
ncbi:cytochrome P450 2J2-like [Podarcis lilfordi]|uniref:Cytochrome P450 2J2-like n=1 Tax=Podarcis lilfordi TaxID=74358 RepID=A0AA35KEM8_9SAUR|nr:cytochrome P450 2J2-like [Podarcis lilfordi]